MRGAPQLRADLPREARIGLLEFGLRWGPVGAGEVKDEIGAFEIRGQFDIARLTGDTANVAVSQFS